MSKNNGVVTADVTITLNVLKERRDAIAAERLEFIESVIPRQLAIFDGALAMLDSLIQPQMAADVLDAEPDAVYDSERVT